MEQPIVRNKWQTERLQTEQDPVSLVRTEFQEECDVNNIVNDIRKYGATAHLNANEPAYGVQDYTTYLEAHRLTADAENMFNELPSKVRSEFKNDPGEFMRYMHDNPDAEKLHKLGLISDEAFKSVKAQAEARKESEVIPTPPEGE